MKTMLTKVFILACALSVLLSTDVLAQQADRGQNARVNYTLEIMSLGVNQFWMANARMPYSMDEVVQAGMLPRNLKNPITGNDLNLYAQSPALGEFVYSHSSDQYATFLFTRAGSAIEEYELDATTYGGPATTTGPDFVLVMYLTWGFFALENYYLETKQVPTSLSDVQGSGYWPFTDEKNPITGEALDFYTVKPGNICFRFNGTQVHVYAIQSDGSHYTSLLDPAQQTYLQY